MNSYDLSGKNAVVTGGAQGIGAAITKRLVASGAQVTIWDQDQVRAHELVLEAGGLVDARAVDVTQFDAVADAAAKLEKIDILICNAGISGPNQPLDEYPLEDWNRVINVNLHGVFHCLKAVTPIMKAKKYGRIVNIASVAGKEGNPNASAYSASKAAVIGLTKSLAKELADLDIAVNCVTPAAARTAIFDQMEDEHIAYMLSKIPRGRFVTVEEIAGLVAYLASPENSFSTGGVFDISGGRATY